ncbi:MAG: glycosyltransferase [Gemmatimonadetes bacterium]|nr:glycosyltransferase [Gemmatimonadota bacterium]
MSASAHGVAGRTPTVSVIMVCYDGAALLSQTLAILTAQTLQDWELVFWDNGSTDGSADIARGLGARVRIFGGPERLTLGAARGEAVALARADLFAFLRS